MSSTHCAGCGTEFEDRTDLVKGYTVRRCPRCRKYHLVGDGRWFEQERFVTHGELVRALRERAAAIEKTKADDDARWRAMLEGDDWDPRWQRMWY
jgi:hypothetical protein